MPTCQELGIGERSRLPSHGPVSKPRVAAQADTIPSLLAVTAGRMPCSARQLAAGTTTSIRRRHT
jgi:hypothetical protein